MGVGRRVLVVSRRLYPPNGGGELSLLAIARHLRSEGASVTLSYAGSAAPSGFDLRALPEPFPGPGMWNRQSANYGAWLRAIRKLIRELEPDIVLTQQEATAAAVQAARSQGVRSIAMLRGTDVLELPARGTPGAWKYHLQAPAFRRERKRYLAALRTADAVIANSRFISSHFEPLIARRASVVYPAVACLRRQVNRMDGHLVMLTPHAHKGGQIVLEMARRMPERKFVLAGNGDACIVNPLRQLPNVEYHAWMDQPHRLFEGAAATLIPSQMYEAFGRVAIESLSHGVPVIASECGGLPEAVGSSGVLVREWTDTPAWCREVSGLLANSARYESMSREGLVQASSFDPAVQMRRFDGILEDTLRSTRRGRVMVAGVPVDPVTPAQAVREVERACHEDRRIAVTTVNSEFIVQAIEDGAFRDALCRSDLAVPDSFGVTLALAWRGVALERCPGVDLVRRLSGRGLRLFLMGSTDAILAAAASRFNHARVDWYAPPFGDLEGAETEKMIERVNRFAPDVLLVALGAPRQDIWIARNLSRLKVHAAIGVGGTFEMISGQLRRCPSILGRVGLEWAFRLAQEPWRWRRCLRLARFLPLAFSGGRA